ncbi:hypothetical protein NMY22_g15988 [Coprinellus aureogranulatus]|nr:hypothetical protein NMY22_g15988 [Coprinellus aureogranulatus]
MVQLAADGSNDRAPSTTSSPLLSRLDHVAQQESCSEGQSSTSASPKSSPFDGSCSPSAPCRGLGPIKAIENKCNITHCPYHPWEFYACDVKNGMAIYNEKCDAKRHEKRAQMSGIEDAPLPPLTAEEKDQIFAEVFDEAKRPEQGAVKTHREYLENHPALFEQFPSKEIPTTIYQPETLLEEVKEVNPPKDRSPRRRLP